MSIVSKIFGIKESIVKWIWNGVVLLFMIGALIGFYKYFSGNDADYQAKLQLSKDGIAAMAKIIKVGKNPILTFDDTQFADYEFLDAPGKRFTGNKHFEASQQIPDSIPVIYAANDPGGIQFAGTREELTEWLRKYDVSDNLLDGVLSLIMGLLLYYGSRKGVL